MSIRAKLYTAIVVVVAGLALTAGVGITAMSRLGDRFDSVERAASASALALQLKFDVTDFNGWQTAYGYDNGKSRSVYLESFARFRRDLAQAREELGLPREQELLDRIESATDDFARLDDKSWAALLAGNAALVKQILLGPELVNFRRAAAASQALAGFEDAQATFEDRAFRDARSDALRLLVLASIVAALLVFILLLTASDLARRAERQLGDETATDDGDQESAEAVMDRDPRRLDAEGGRDHEGG